VSKKLYRVHGVSNSLWNEDLAQVSGEERTWRAGRYLSAWIAMSVCVPMYLLASGLVLRGMTSLEAVGTLLLGALIVWGVTLLCGDAGVRYGIPFPVYLRASFGVAGAQVPLVLRALVACGWFGIQSWIGGIALFAGLRIVMPEWVGPGAEGYCFAVFWIGNMIFAQAGERITRAIRLVSALLLLVAAFGLVLSMAKDAGGLAILLSNGSAVPHPSGTASSLRLFLSSLTAVIGFWAAVALGASDLTRRAKSAKEYGIGQGGGLLSGLLYAAFAIAATAAAVIAKANYGVWNPVALIAHLPQTGFAVAGLLIVMLAALSMDITSGPAGPASVFANLGRNFLSVRVGGLIAGVVGVLWMPWRLIADPERYLHGWLTGVSGVLGPVAGVMIVDYFVVRRRSLDVEGLYVRGGLYEYSGGFNLKALLALAIGIATVLAGFLVPQLHWLYDGAWFVGFGVAGLAYLILMTGPPEVALNPPTPLLIPMQGFEAEGA
jgi:NCS1 family nucleobase:cation symporter-1